MSLVASSASYCPVGYAMSIGLVGTYYVITVKSREYTRWWWGDYPTVNTSDSIRQVVVSNENTMAKEYVYQKSGDSENFYYLGA